MAADRMPHAHPHTVDAAIALFSRQGYEQTTVEEIADTAQISRATFFRRYRSKEDVVFADHELLLEEVTALLTAAHPGAEPDPYLVVCRGARLVFDHHLSQRDTSLARYRLLQQVPALRDRELVTTHRYERLFTRYLQDTLPDDQSGSVQSIAFAAGIVAVHNAFLRRWLRTPEVDLRPELEQAFTQLRRMAAIGSDGTVEPPSPGSPSSGSPSSGSPSSSHGRTTTRDAPGARVVVVEVDATTSADDVADVVRRALT